MIRERDEFKAYTEKPVYRAKGKRDLSFLGRFTFSMLQEKMEGLGHILTVIARGFLFDGGDAYANIAKAHRALYAWCSIPEKIYIFVMRTLPKAGGLMFLGIAYLIYVSSFVD